MALYFSPDEVQTLVEEESKNGQNALEENGVAGLKDRVLERVREVTGITGDIPTKIRTWVHQFCLKITAGIEPKFVGDSKLSAPFDLESLPQQQRPK